MRDLWRKWEELGRSYICILALVYVLKNVRVALLFWMVFSITFNAAGSQDSPPQPPSGSGFQGVPASAQVAQSLTGPPVLRQGCAGDLTCWEGFVDWS